jgi:integrase
LTIRHIVALCSERNWSVEHRRSMRSSLITFFDWAKTNGLVDENPAALLPRVAASPPAPRPAPDYVWSELLANAQPRERLMALLAGEAGLRRAEVAAVRCDDLIQDLYGWSLLVRGKGGRQRVVPLTDRLSSEIRRYCDCPAGFLFPGQIDGHISPGWAGTVISRLMADGYTMHKLRHRYATRGFAGTGNLRAVQEALGHASVATTQRYTAISAADVRLVSEAAANVRPVLQNGDVVA